MESKTKLASALMLAVPTLVGGAYLSGTIAIKLVDLATPLTIDLWWRCLKALDDPSFAPYTLRIKGSVFTGFAVPILGWGAVVLRMFQRPPEAAHGDARFATLAELRRAGLLTRRPESILIGASGRHRLWLSGAQHVIVISPTRSGKTTSIAIPVLMTYEHSMVVLDVKGELHRTTSGCRKALGQKVFVWAPYDEAGRTDRFNPMTPLASMDPAKRIGELQTIAAILYPDDGGRDPFWSAQSRAAFVAFGSYLFEAWDHGLREMTQAGLPAEARPQPNTSTDFPSFERILGFSSGTQAMGTQALLKSIVGDASLSWVSRQTRTVFTNLAGLAEDTFSSVIATMQAPLQQFLSPILAAATNATDFDVDRFRREPTTLYVVIPTHKLDESAKLLNIFFSALIGRNLGKQLGEEPDLKYQMLMLMDEFTAMGRVDVWSKRISISASYGVRDLCIVQSRAQLRSTYGDHDAQNFITNHGAQVVFAPREQSDANEYSEMLGYRTQRQTQRSVSRGGSGHQVSTSQHDERRALMLPQEIKELPADEELIFYEGCKPIRARKNWFFKDKGFKALAALPPTTVSAKPSAIAAPPPPAAPSATGKLKDALAA
ncbi:type IV secretory system conjugative DNA transfer family protein [Luteibacter sp. 329MFSha]|uniref:type IV secretory system conjugative DNA transfer family protein n=1 Tax=Luteibacter sp. 329MFSha TaxID=1798239 RepID=UPI0008C630C4|nr:type IV secretory system conjugative DNA transfer family protein [Luteibacter sp. 329MFSha]SEW13466.1 type IV secretion system protein VirD4 [Luteibacter sp. 329MFSha]